MLQLMLITNSPSVAAKAQAAGIDRIFVDLEYMGKAERQKSIHTEISAHAMNDITPIRNVLDSSQLLVRINPLHAGTELEINEALARGAEILMLPMFTSAEEVHRFVDLIGGRATTNLLLETPQALARIDEVLDVPGIDEIHIGLNDLHLGLRLSFLFEPLSGGIIDYLANRIRAKGIHFGFGGIACLGDGLLPAEQIVVEHYRLGSEMVILSRLFSSKATTVSEDDLQASLCYEVQRLREWEAQVEDFTSEQLEANRREVFAKVRQIVKRATPTVI